MSSWIDSQMSLSLWNACRNGDLTMLQTLDELRFADNRADAFRLACLFGHLPIVEYLVLGSTDPMTQEVRSGFTLMDLRSGNNYALHTACKYKHLPIVEYLCAHGLTAADIRCYGNYALREARCYRDIAQILIWAGQYTHSEARAIIKDPVVLASLIFERPEPAFEDLVKPAFAYNANKREPAFDLLVSGWEPACIFKAQHDEEIEE